MFNLKTCKCTCFSEPGKIYKQIFYWYPQISLTTVLPKGVNAMPANLKCCKPNGMPMIVRQSSVPNIKWVIQMGKPAMSHKMFMMVLKHPGWPGSKSTLLPNGHNMRMPNLNACSPNGIPMIVMQRTTPAQKY